MTTHSPMRPRSCIRAAIGSNPKRVGLFLGQQVRGLAQPACYVVVEARSDHSASISCRLSTRSGPTALHSTGIGADALGGGDDMRPCRGLGLLAISTFLDGKLVDVERQQPEMIVMRCRGSSPHRPRRAQGGSPRRGLPSVHDAAGRRRDHGARLQDGREGAGALHQVESRRCSLWPDAAQVQFGTDRLPEPYQQVWSGSTWPVVCSRPAGENGTFPLW